MLCTLPPHVSHQAIATALTVTAGQSTSTHRRPSDTVVRGPGNSRNRRTSMRLIRALSLTLMTAAVSLAAAPAFAQSAARRVAGVVRDSSGATVPGAAITVTNDQTRASQSAVSGPDGSFSVT